MTTPLSTTRARTLPSGKPRPRYDKESLLQVAVSVFTERGYDRTSMEDLSKASGLSKSSLYHHIDSKEQLLRLSLERAIEPLLATLGDEGSKTGPAIDRLAHVIRRQVGVLSDELPYVTLLLRVRGNTETERWALTQRRKFDKAIAGLVQQAIDEGDVRADVDARVTARLVMGMVNSLIEWHRPRKAKATEEIAEEIVTLVFAGIRT